MDSSQIAIAIQIAVFVFMAFGWAATAEAAARRGVQVEKASLKHEVLEDKIRLLVEQNAGISRSLKVQMSNVKEGVKSYKSLLEKYNELEEKQPKKPKRIYKKRVKK